MNGFPATSDQKLAKKVCLCLTAFINTENFKQNWKAGRFIIEFICNAISQGEQQNQMSPQHTQFSSAFRARSLAKLFLLFSNAEIDFSPQGAVQESYF